LNFAAAIQNAVIAGQLGRRRCGLRTFKEAMGATTPRRLARLRRTKGLPPQIAGGHHAGPKKINESKEFRDFMANRGFGARWGLSERAAAPSSSPTATSAVLSCPVAAVLAAITIAALLWPLDLWLMGLRRRMRPP